MKIQVAVRDKVGKDFVIEEIRYATSLAKEDLERIAKETEKVIQNKIMTKSRMPTGKLASFFYAENLSSGNRIEWGIGNIQELDQEVSYWNHLDKGSEGIGANWQHYLPKGFWANGRWVENPNGYAGIQPQTPIQAFNYIAETIAEMNIKIQQLLKNSDISSILLRG